MLDIICLNDEEVICSDCAVFDIHKGHSVQKLSEFFQKFTISMETLKTLKTKMILGMEEIEKTFYPIEI